MYCCAELTCRCIESALWEAYTVGGQRKALCKSTTNCYSSKNFESGVQKFGICVALVICTRCDRLQSREWYTCGSNQASANGCIWYTSWQQCRYQLVQRTRFRLHYTTSLFLTPQRFSTISITWHQNISIGPHGGKKATSTSSSLNAVVYQGSSFILLRGLPWDTNMNWSKARPTNSCCHNTPFHFFHTHCLCRRTSATYTHIRSQAILVAEATSRLPFLTDHSETPSDFDQIQCGGNNVTRILEIQESYVMHVTPMVVLPARNHALVSNISQNGIL